MGTERIAAACCLSFLLSCSGPPESGVVTGPDLEGSWRAVLLSPGGELPFGLDIAGEGEDWSAVIVNGEERAATSGVTVDGDLVTVAFDWYDSRIEARIAGEGRMSGRWIKTAAAGGVSQLDFTAEKGAGERFRTVAEERPGAALSDVSGVWRVEFLDDSGSEAARGEFRQDGSRVSGTFLTPTGDYRFLEGNYGGGLLRLSTFDGAHAFLFRARVEEDGSLRGDFWSRDSYHATWTAERVTDGEAILPDAWSLAGLTNDEGRFHFEFDDLASQTLSSADPRFDGKVVLVNIFGSWCPNCNDKAPLLAQWYRDYRDRGLEIVGLAYEYSGDRERDRRYVGKFAERHGVEFPLLLAGTSDKRQAASTLPDLTAVIAFPTSIFIGRDGKVRRIHSGFSGPGTGRHYDDLVAELEGLIQELLAESA